MKRYATAPSANILLVGSAELLRRLFDGLTPSSMNGLADVIAELVGDAPAATSSTILGATTIAVDDACPISGRCRHRRVVSSGDNGDEFSTVGDLGARLPGIEPMDHLGDDDRA